MHFLLSPRQQVDEELGALELSGWYLIENVNFTQIQKLRLAPLDWPSLVLNNWSRDL